MFRHVTKAASRPVALLSGGLMAAAALLGPATPATAQIPAAHWGNYEWSGGVETADVRAFWLFDRTGDPTLNAIIAHVAGAWNGARTENPELPHIAVFQDDANAGRCFVNRTPGWSVASACVMPGLSTLGIKGIAATEGSPHMIGGAFAVSGGLDFEEAFTVVCHNIGHLMGLADSDDAESCMSHDSAPGELKWYGAGDAEAILALYGHDDGQAPAAVADAYSTSEDVALTVAAPGVLANDTDAEGDTLTAVKVSDPTDGSVTLNADGSLTYTPDADFNGTDSFTYKAVGAGTDSNVATVTITVAPAGEAPVAVADTHTIAEDTVLTVAGPGVLGNDTAEGDTLTAVKVSDPTNGSLTLNTNGSFTYTPEPDFNGSDSFTYKANDGSTDSNVATVTITVTAVNDAPVAVDDTGSTTLVLPVEIDALANDTDVDQDALTATNVSDPANGTVTVNDDGSVTYTADAGFTGDDTFTYTANDGTVDSNVATVTVTVGPEAAV